MKTQLTRSTSSTSIWQRLHEIDELFNLSLPLVERLEKINNLLIEALDIDAIWCVTINPLPPTACGLVRTPLRVNPQAKVSMVDTIPPLENSWLASNTPLAQAIATKTPIFIQPNNIENNQIDTDLGDVLFGTFHTTPQAIVPLVAANVSLGALIVGHHTQVEASLSKETQNLLAHLSKHLAQSLHHIYLTERSERHTNVLLTLNQIAQTITSSLNIDDVLQKTMTGINTILDVEAGSLLLLDQETNELHFKITLRGENKQVTSYRLKKDEGIAGWVVTHNRPTIVNDPHLDKRFLSKIDESIGFKTKMILCVPLVVQGRSIGALEVLNKRTGYFNEDDQKLLVSMTAALGIALQNAILYNAAQERAQINKTIGQITAAINVGYSLKETVKIISDQFERLFTFDHINISWLDNTRENVRQWAFNEYGSLEQTKQITPLNKSRLAHIIKIGRGYVEDDISNPKSKNKRYSDDQILLADQIKSTVTVPLMKHKTPYGSLTLGRQIGIYNLRDLKLLEHLAPQVAIAIDKALLIDAIEQRANELQLLNRLGEMLVSTTDISLIVDTTLNMLPRLLPGDIQGVIIADEEGCYAGTAVPYKFDKVKQTTKTIFDTFLELREDDVLLELISTKNIAGNMPVTDDWKPVTVLSLPILTRQGSQGIIYMASGREESLGDDLLRVFSLLVSQVSSAVENAHLFHQAEQERARLAAILASSTDAILVVNKNGRIVLDNPAAWKVMDSQGSKSGQLLSESTNSKTLINLFKKGMQGTTTPSEIPLENGQTFYANLSPVSVGKAGIIGWVATMQDISHFKELDELKDNFVSTVSHDLRSPLGSILIAASLVAQSGEVNEAQKEMLGVIEGRVNTMGQLIDNLLDVGKIEAGIDMDMTPSDISAMITEVTEEFIPQATDKTIQLTINLDNDLPLVMANLPRLRQVVHNLMGNAIKYTLNKGRVTVKTDVKDNEIRIQISDTGIGIPAGDQPHVFEKFYRVHSDEVINIKGTGLGLAIVKGIIDKHNGRIWLESVFGKGSTFTVALPVYKENTP